MQLLIVLAVVILVIAIFIYDGYQGQRRQRQRMLNHGKKLPKQTKSVPDKMKLYYYEEKETLPEDECIDEITWDDLEMDRVFQRMNYTLSFAGEQVLYKRLHQIPVDKSGLEAFEKKVSGYQGDKKKRSKMLTLLDSLGKEENSYYLPVFISNLDTLGIRNIWLYRIMQAALFISLFLAVLTRHPAAIVPALLIFLVNAVIYAVKKGNQEVYIDTLGTVIRIVKTAEKLTKVCGQDEKLPEGLAESLNAFHRVNYMVGVIQKKRQAAMSGDMIGLLRDYFVGATLWDFTNYHKVIARIRGKQEDFSQIYRFVGETDMAAAVACFRESLPHYCAPVFVGEKIWEAADMYHPMLSNPVSNTVYLDHNSMITGSNASGKSTFIKAVAVNSILGQNINTCMARSIRIMDARIITSMAVRDDMDAGESYYIKEIKYLNRIMRSVGKERPVICMIDEILKGTNTKERIAASYAVLRYLNRDDCLAVAATHDIELVELLGEEYQRYYFSEQIQQDDIVFDYKIKNGMNSQGNAVRLLAAFDFPGRVIKEALQTYAAM